MEKHKIRTFNVTNCFNGTESNLIKNMLLQEGAEVCIGLVENADGTLSCKKKESELIAMYKNKERNSAVYSETASRLLYNMNEAENYSRYLIYGWELKPIEDVNKIGKGIGSEEFGNALNKTDYNKNKRDLVLLCAGARAESSLISIYDNMKTIAEGEWRL